jgi:DNA-binding MarR family transcriptional regulator
MPWHKGSIFTAGPRHPLSPDQRRAWLARVELERRAGRLTPAYADIARTLLRHLAEDGRCDPCQTTLAERSGYSPRTVARALSALHTVGLLDWERRLVRHGNRVEQTSNSYRLLLPQEPIAPAAICRPASKNQSTKDSIARLAIAPPPAPDPDARRALEQIAAARAARFNEAWEARRAARWG